MIKVKIIEERCIGCGGCIALAPKIFEYSEEAIAQIKNEFRIENKRNFGLIPDKFVENIKQIVKLCPTYAIEIEE